VPATRESSKSTKAAGLTDSMLRQYENEFKLLRRPPKEHQPNAAQSQESPREVSSSPDLQEATESEVRRAQESQERLTKKY